MASPKPRKLSVYLYIPNIIGYIRVLMNVLAFAICFSNKKLFSGLYFISFVCDGVDGWCARKFNQVSTFGAVLDMITDRISTACLLVILSQVYRPGFIFLLLLALDIASHWLQMYSTFLLGKVSHKDVKDSTSWLFRLYYGNRMFMAYCCVACEVLYIMLFLLAQKQPESITHGFFTRVPYHESRAWGCFAVLGCFAIPDGDSHGCPDIYYAGLSYFYFNCCKPLWLGDQASHQRHTDENSSRCLCAARHQQEAEGIRERIHHHFKHVN